MNLADWPVIGRDEEFAVLVGEIVERGRSVVIAGPAGVGKSRLAREVLHQVGGGAARYVTATRSAATTPLGALLGVLSAADVRDLAESGHRSALFRQAALELRDDAEAGTVPVLGIDDAHLLDDVSAALIHQLAEQGDARLLVTLRTGEPAPDAVTALWRDDLAERLELQPLGRDDVGALLRDALPGADDEGTASRVWKATGGNPLYLRELVREAQRVGDLCLTNGTWRWDGRSVPVGARLRELMSSSLADLSDDARTVLDLLAIGEPLPSEALDDIDPEAVATCERQGLVVVDRARSGPVLRLHHPMLAEVLRAELADADRRRLSAHLADLPGLAAIEPLRVATWHVDAGRTASPDLLLAASTVALRSFDAGLAERLAVAAGEAGGGHQAVLAVARARIAEERYAEAEAVLAPLEAELDDERELVGVAKLLSDIRFWGLGRPKDAEAGLVGVGERLTDATARLHVLALRASIKNDAGDIDGALALTEWATDPTVDVGARLQAVTSAASALTLSGRPLDALALCDELLPVALERAEDNPRDVGRVLAQRIHALVGLARLDEAQDTIAYIHGIAADAGDDEVQGGAALVLGQLAVERGQVATAAGWLREAAVVLGRFDPQHNLPWCLALQAWTATTRGDAAGARAYAEEAERSAGASPVRVGAVRIGLAGAHAAAAAGELTRAGELAVAAADRAEAAGNRFSAGLALEAAVGFGASPAPLAARLARLADGTQIVWMELWRDHAVAVAAGDAAALDDVAERFAAVGARLRAAHAFELAAAAYARDGRRSSATRAHGRAAGQLAECEGALLPAAAAAAAGAGNGSPTSWLTRREREIASLAATGLSNQEIADRLSIGVRTVEGHILRATTKLGVRGRGELAAALESPEHA